MSKETLKELVMTNDGKKRKKKAKKSGKKATRRTTKRSKKKGGSKRRRTSSGRRTSCRSVRRRNPEGGIVAAAKQFVGGAIAMAVVTPVAHLVGGKVTSPVARGAVKTAISAVVPGLAGVALQRKAPNLAAGMMGAAGALGAAQAIAMVGRMGTQPNALLEKAGFLQLGSPASIFERDGIYWRRRDDGVEEALAGLGQPESVLLTTGDGEQVQALLLGSFEQQGLSLVRVGDQFALVPAGGTVSGVGELVEEGGVGELVQETVMNGPDEVPSSIGDAGDVPSSIGGYQG